MNRQAYNLYTAQQLEELLGKKYFYRQIIYRLADEGSISSFNTDGTLYFSIEEVKRAILEKLARRIRYRFPWVTPHSFRISFDKQKAKEIIIFNSKNKFSITANTEIETEEDLLKKIEKSREEVIKMQDIPLDQPPPPPYGALPPPPPGPEPHHPPSPPPHHEVIMEALRRIEEALARIEAKLK